jgi:hypothetical protein
MENDLILVEERSGRYNGREDPCPARQAFRAFKEAHLRRMVVIVGKVTRSSRRSDMLPLRRRCNKDTEVATLGTELDTELKHIRTIVKQVQWPLVRLVTRLTELEIGFSLETVWMGWTTW